MTIYCLSTKWDKEALLSRPTVTISIGDLINAAVAVEEIKCDLIMLGSVNINTNVGIDTFKIWNVTLTTTERIWCFS